jgi:fructokinase
MNTNPVVCFGEMLWDVLPAGAKPGGAPMNVAYHLQKLGMWPAVISRVGTDEWGEQLLALLKKSGITTAYVQQDIVHQTGVVLAKLNERAEATYDIVSPVAWDFIGLHEDLKKLVQEADYFVFGSLAARSETSRNTLFQLLQAAKTKVLDINLRAPHFTKAAVEPLLQQCRVLKINDQELPLIAGWYASVKTIEDQMKLLQDRFDIPTIVTTCGSDGAVLRQDGETFKHPGFKVIVKDTIGSGDAFLAALLYKLNSHAPPADALDFANRLGAFIASREGACPPYDLSEVTAVMGV